MSTRLRWSPRRKIRPAAWPTLSANSGVISPLARPRMPSVPKYLRAMFPKPNEGKRFDAMIRQFDGRNVKNVRTLAPMMNGAAGPAGGAVWLMSSDARYYFFFLSAALGGGWVTLIG